MNVLKAAPDPRIKTKLFPLSSFVLTFFALGLLTTGQMLIIRTFIDLGNVRTVYIMSIILYWLLAAAAFILFTRRQFIKKIEKPMEELAEATRKVAGGDFSIYVPPRNLADKMDYIDVIVTDFNKMVEELGSMETLKTDFFSNVSHEIKTPLVTIQNYAQELKNGNLTETQREDYIDTIIESSTRLSDLIGNLLKLNKLEKQTIQPVCEPYDLCAQLCECALRFEKQWENKRIEFEAEIEDHLIIEEDSGLLELVWNNLISNAIKFTEQGDIVTLRQIQTENEIIVSVSDSGCGMNDKTLKHIFDKFYQGDTSHSTEGNGLGLALVLRIMQLIGGSITASSEPGEGSTFTVKIPKKLKGNF